VGAAGIADRTRDLVGGVGLLILPPAVLSYLLAAVMVRYVIRHRHAAAMQRALREVQRPGMRRGA
jgi:hypothetical protein